MNEVVRRQAPARGHLGRTLIAAVTLSVHGANAAPAAAEADEWMRQLPAGYEVIVTRSGDLNGDGLTDVVVALARKDETALAKKRGAAPKRPLLIFFGRPGGHFQLVGRNDRVVANLDKEWQCDPFTSSSDSLTLKGRYFTVENAAACGTHWSDYVTFRYDRSREQILFWKEIYQNWNMNRSPDRNAEALVRDADEVVRANPARPVEFSQYIQR